MSPSYNAEKKIFAGNAVKECALVGQMREFGDPAVLLRLIYAASKATTEGEDVLEQFCELHSLRLKGVKEIWKLRSQLVSEINLRHPELNLSIQPNLKPPTDTQVYFPCCVFENSIIFKFLVSFAETNSSGWQR